MIPPLVKVPPESNDGGQAFPRPMVPGMSLRDYFAGQALAGLVGTELSYERLAEVCYTQADAMLAQRLIDPQSAVEAQQISAGVKP